MNPELVARHKTPEAAIDVPHSASPTTTPNNQPPARLSSAMARSPAAISCPTGTSGLIPEDISHGFEPAHVDTTFTAAASRSRARLSRPTFMCRGRCRVVCCSSERSHRHVASGCFFTVICVTVSMECSDPPLVEELGSINATGFEALERGEGKELVPAISILCSKPEPSNRRVEYPFSSSIGTVYISCL